MDAEDVTERRASECSDQPTEPSLARVVDWLLGGTQHWHIDRELGERLKRIVPDIEKHQREGRLFQQRVVRFALDTGVRQFVDIASGLPTQGCVHETADEHAPERQPRVVYVDNDPAVYAHAARLLDGEGNSRCAAVNADLLRSAELWNRVLDTGQIAPDEPVCLFVTGLYRSKT